MVKVSALGGPIELFLVRASAPRLVYTQAVVCDVLSCLLDYAYKRTLAAN